MGESIRKIMLADGKSRRITERKHVDLWVKVYCRETHDRAWEEMSSLLDISVSGASFSIKNPVVVGQLLHLTLPMPKQLRVYDHQETDYRIWAVVRSVKMPESTSKVDKSFEVGVAFAGKEPPASFSLNPKTLYDLRPAPTRQGTWQLRERPRRDEFS